MINKAIKIIGQKTSSKSFGNIFWNFSAGIWGALLTLFTTPLYVSKLGLDLYGVLSLWLVMQSMMNLFDFGLGSTVIRKFARVDLNQSSREIKQNLLKTVEIFYWSISGLIVIIIMFFSDFIAIKWLNYNGSDSINLSLIIKFIGITLFFQFPNVLYSSGLIGLQEQKSMNIIQIVSNSFRFLGGAFILFWHRDLIWFFSWQIIIAAAQAYISRFLLLKNISIVEIKYSPKFDISLLNESAKFSLGMAFTSFAAVLLTNIDRIAISKILTTSELGRYALAFTASGFLQLCIQPFYKAFFPRFSELYSLGDQQKLRIEYYNSCRWIALLIIILGSIGFIYAPELFYIWLGQEDKTAILIFRLLTISITCSGLGWLPAAFQQAQGWTSLHVKMIFGAIALGTPIMIFALKEFGVVGGTSVWLIHGISDITLGIWLMHRRLLKGEFLKWYKFVILPPIICSIPISYVSHLLMPTDFNRVETFIWLSLVGIIVLLFTLAIILKCIKSLE